MPSIFFSWHGLGIEGTQSNTELIKHKERDYTRRLFDLEDKIDIEIQIYFAYVSAFSLHQKFSISYTFFCKVLSTGMAINIHPNYFLPYGD